MAVRIINPRMSQRGFTLVELVLVIIILGVLAAVAVPQYISMGASARISSLKMLAGTIMETAINTRAMCKTNPACDWGSQYQFLNIGGRFAEVNYGWLDAGDSIGVNEIDAWVIYPGFTASVQSGIYTVFSVDGAPDPPNCSVQYRDVYFLGPAATPSITTTTSGC